MAYARVAGCFGVALALGDAPAARLTEDAMFRDYDLQSDRASISSGVEVACNEVIVLGNSAGWAGDLKIAHRPMADALDIGGVAAVLGDLGLAAAPQLSASDAARIPWGLEKDEPGRREIGRAHV